MGKLEGVYNGGGGSTGAWLEADKQLDAVNKRIDELDRILQRFGSSQHEMNLVRWRVQGFDERIAKLEQDRPESVADTAPTVAVPVDVLREANCLLPILAAWSGHDIDTQMRARATYRKISALLEARG